MNTLLKIGGAALILGAAGTQKGCIPRNYEGKFVDGEAAPVTLSVKEGAHSVTYRTVDQDGNEVRKDVVMTGGQEGKPADFVGIPAIDNRHEYLQENIRRNVSYAAGEAAKDLYKSIVDLQAQQKDGEKLVKEYEAKIKTLEAGTADYKKLQTDLEAAKKTTAELTKQLTGVQKQLAESDGKYKSLAEDAQKALNALKKPEEKKE